MLFSRRMSDGYSVLVGELQMPLVRRVAEDDAVVPIVVVEGAKDFEAESRDVEIFKSGDGVAGTGYAEGWRCHRLGRSAVHPICKRRVVNI